MVNTKNMVTTNENKEDTIFNCYYDFVQARNHRWDSTESALTSLGKSLTGNNPYKAVKLFTKIVENHVNELFRRVIDLVVKGCDVYIELSTPGTRRGITNNRMKLFIHSEADKYSTLSKLRQGVRYSMLNKYTDIPNDAIDGVSKLYVSTPDNKVKKYNMAKASEMDKFIHEDII